MNEEKMKDFYHSFLEHDIPAYQMAYPYLFRNKDLDDTWKEFYEKNYSALNLEILDKDGIIKEFKYYCELENKEYEEEQREIDEEEYEEYMMDASI